MTDGVFQFTIATAKGREFFNIFTPSFTQIYADRYIYIVFNHSHRHKAICLIIMSEHIRDFGNSAKTSLTDVEVSTTTQIIS